MKKNIQPLKDNVLIEPVKTNKKTGSGIYLPDNASEKRSNEGKVVEIGDSSEIKVKKGQLVVFNSFAGTEIDDKYLVVKNEDIIAVIK
ncbi:10 kDa chaperonin [bacterium BMS3Abin15]|nr:10 kDa chaperonin [bacterium BMS3Abin15]HDH07507.1 co-chaperone GroES [Candidatus Moranbacteria bacterium]HDZ85678.1 co-chaperone GroES [Candidatus Moranbacteria bacterium]